MSPYKPAGFTLIELMIVLVIMALSLSLILPLSMRQIDQAKERSERELVVLLLDKARRDSYFNSTPQQLTFTGRRMVGYWPEEKVYDFEFVAFSDATVQVEASGRSVPQQITASIDGKRWKLEIEHETAGWFNAD